jgi:hypothetical protein
MRKNRLHKHKHQQRFLPVKTMKQQQQWEVVKEALRRLQLQPLQAFLSFAQHRRKGWRVKRRGGKKQVV